jgi:pimeloyl-ACP methyl ester carboxylesterase
MTAVPTERLVELAGIRSRVLEVAGAGPTVLLLHGFTDSADSWRPVLAELASRGRRAVAVDLPGHGRAEPLARPAFATIDRFTDALVDRYAADGPVVLAGNSLGGLAALRAATRPERPLLAVAGLGPAGLAYHRRIERIVGWARRLDPAFRAADRIPVPSPLIRWVMAGLYQHRLAEGAADPSTVRRYASHYQGRRDLARRRADLLEIGGAPEALEVDLERIRVPVLLVWGRRDRLADIRGATTLLDIVPDSRLVVVDAGHCPQVQLAAQIADLLSDLPDLSPREPAAPQEAPS